MARTITVENPMIATVTLVAKKARAGFYGHAVINLTAGGSLRTPVGRGRPQAESAAAIQPPRRRAPGLPGES